MHRDSVIMPKLRGAPEPTKTRPLSFHIMPLSRERRTQPVSMDCSSLSIMTTPEKSFFQRIAGHGEAFGTTTNKISSGLKYNYGRYHIPSCSPLILLTRQKLQQNWCLIGRRSNFP